MSVAHITAPPVVYMLAGGQRETQARNLTCANLKERVSEQLILLLSERSYLLRKQRSGHDHSCFPLCSW